MYYPKQWRKQVANGKVVRPVDGKNVEFDSEQDYLDQLERRKMGGMFTRTGSTKAEMSPDPGTEEYDAAIEKHEGGMVLDDEDHGEAGSTLVAPTSAHPSTLSGSVGGAPAGKTPGAAPLPNPAAQPPKAKETPEDK
jgi:hypothetical protein